MAAQGGQGHVRGRTERHPKNGAENDLEQPPPGRSGTPDRSPARVACGRARGAAVCRAESSSLRGNVEEDGGSGLTGLYALTALPTVMNPCVRGALSA